MLRYAGYIEAANHYELPRPPRRGSHRPEAPPLPFTRAASVSPRAPGGAPPLPFLVGAAPLSRSGGVSSYSLLGKRALESPSPTFSKHASMRLTLAEQFARDSATFDLALRDDLLEQRSSCSLEYARSRERSFVKQEVYRFHRDELHALASYPVKADATRATKTSPGSVKFVHKVARSSRSKEPYSPRRSILESYARTIPLSASCQSVQKRCSFTGCSKISVSRGLCRGHGGGRRCQFTACTKSAQSRSNFCWAHGGGQRCDVQGCMRSRKSKRFCVAHIALEDPALFAQEQAQHDARTKPHIGHSARGREPAAQRTCEQARRYLPSLGQALYTASHSSPNLPCSFRVACTFSV